MSEHGGSKAEVFREDLDATLRGLGRDTLELRCPEHGSALTATYHDGVVTLRCRDDVVCVLRLGSRHERRELLRRRADEKRKIWRSGRF